MNIFTSRLRRTLTLPYYSFPSAGLFIGLLLGMGIMWLPMLFLNMPFYKRLELYPNSLFLFVGGCGAVVFVCAMALTNLRLGLQMFIVTFPILNKARIVLSFVTPEVLITPVTVTIMVLFLVALARQNVNPILKWQNPMKTYDKLIFLLPLMAIPSILVADYKGVAFKAYTQSFIEPVLLYYVIRSTMTKDTDEFLLFKYFGQSIVLSVTYIFIELFAYWGPLGAFKNFLSYGLRMGGERSAATGGYSEVVTTAALFGSLVPLFFSASYYYKSRFLEYCGFICISVTIWSLSRGPTAVLSLFLPYFLYSKRKEMLCKSGLKLLLVIVLLCSVGSSYLINRWETALGTAEHIKPSMRHEIFGINVGWHAWYYLHRSTIGLETALEHPLGIGGFQPEFQGAGIPSIAAEYGIFTFVVLFAAAIWIAVKLIKKVKTRVATGIIVYLLSFALCLFLSAGTLTPKFYGGDPQSAYLVRWGKEGKLNLPYNDKAIWLFMILATGAVLIFTQTKDKRIG